MSFIQRNMLFILIGTLGGSLVSLTGIPIAWMMGSLLFSLLFSTLPAKWITDIQEKKGIHPYWRQLGQALLGIELGQSFHISIMDTFEDHFFIIIGMVISSIAIAFLSGMLLWRFSKANMMTSLFGTTPGGISAMPTIAEEVGANAFVVSIIQTLRILLVVGVIPIFAGTFTTSSITKVSGNSHGYVGAHNLLFTGFLLLGAFGGAMASKKINMPAPWLVGSMLGVAIVQMLCPILLTDFSVAYWPDKLIIIAQILIGTSIGSSVNKEMFKGFGQIICVGLLSSIGLVISMLVCSILIAELTHIPLVTCILAFAPGGVAEMATTAIALHADSTFVVAVQSLRLISILIILPPLFRFLNNSVQINSVR